MGGRFVESVKNAWWSVRQQETGDGLERIVEFRHETLRGRRLLKSHGLSETPIVWGNTSL